MSLLNLKSIFSPTNTKFQDNQSDLTTFPRQIYKILIVFMITD